MKKTIMLAVVAVVVAVAAIMPTKASAQKLGHINSQEIVALMPERDDAVTKLQAYQKELQETFTSMQNDYQTKLKDYQDKQTTWTESIKKTKEDELVSIQQRMQQFAEQAEQEIAQRQETLFSPIVKKAQDAINKVAKAQGLTYVLDLATGAILYMDDATAVNLLPLVKAELGIPASKTQPTQIQ